MFFSAIVLAIATDVWAGLATHPAVVNPVSYEYFGKGDNVISLSGEWDFTTRPHGSGSRAARFATDMWQKKSRKIRVPGVWEAQGVGEDGWGIPHLCADNSPKRIKSVFVGEGWYRRYFEIPKAWENSRIWLKVGGVRSMGCFYINDHAVSWVETSVGALKWDVTPFINFGTTNKIVAMADNALAVRGSATASLNRWGGLWRDVEIEATPSVYIDDAWVQGDFDAREAVVRVIVGGIENQSQRTSLHLSATVEGASVKVDAKPGLNEIRVPLASFRPWSPEKPHLYWAQISLQKDGEKIMSRHERFGVRKLEVRGKQFFLNDKPFFVRGFGDNAQYPITGCNPPDRALHRKHLSVARKAGFNFVRHHTHSEAPEYMEAADECGILVQPELPYYLDAPNDYFGYDPIRDVNDLITAFRRYTSFAVVSFGNEGLLGPAANKIVYDHVKKHEKSLLVLSQDGGTYVRDNHGEGESDFCSGPLIPWERGSFNLRTFVCHEYLNLAVKFDWRTEKDFTGVWLPPMKKQDRISHLAHANLDEPWLERLQDSAHALQAYWQKYGIELARADPYCDGFSYWTITDSVQFKNNASVFAGQGLFDVFWRQKRGGLSPEEFSVFNSPSVILLDTEVGERKFEETKERYLCCRIDSPHIEGTNRVYVSGEVIKAKILFSHFGEKMLTDAQLEWKIESKGNILCSAVKNIGNQELGPARIVGELNVSAPKVLRPTQVELCAIITSFAGFKCKNRWSMWIFPDSKFANDPSNVVVAEYGSILERKSRAEGRNLLVLANQGAKTNILLGWWGLGSQCGTAFVKHPVLGDFPFEPYLSPVVFRIAGEGVKLPVEGYGPNDYVAVTEGTKDAYLLLAAKERADGSREAFVAGLDIGKDLVESRSLRKNILNWVSKGKGK